MLNFYRVENMLHRGPYNGGLIGLCWDLNALTNDNAAPTPEQDGLGAGPFDYSAPPIWTRDDVFGFRCLRDLTAWFNMDMLNCIQEYIDRELENLYSYSYSDIPNEWDDALDTDQLDFYVRGYALPDNVIRHGVKQAVAPLSLLSMNTLQWEVPIDAFVRDYDKHSATA